MKELKNKRTRVLFVCAANCNRSPAFEIFFKKRKELKDKFEFKSAGVYFGYPFQVNEDILNWADKVFVMDLEQMKFIDIRYHLHMNKVEVIGVSDQYDVEDEKLQEIIDYWYATVFSKMW